MSASTERVREKPRHGLPFHESDSDIDREGPAAVNA